MANHSISVISYVLFSCMNSLLFQTNTVSKSKLNEVSAVNNHAQCFGGNFVRLNSGLVKYILETNR